MIYAWFILCSVTQGSWSEQTVLMKKATYYIKIIFTLLVLTALHTAYTDEITVVTENWEPYNFEKNGEVAGISTEIVKACLNKANISIKNNRIQLYPWVRAYQKALDEKNVLIYTILKTPEREKKFKWIGPIIPSERFHLYKRRGQDLSLRSLEDAKEFQIGCLRGSVHVDFLLKRGFPECSIQTVPDQRQNLLKLLGGRVDFIIDTDSSLTIRTKQMGLPIEKFEKSLFIFENDYYMAFSEKTSDELVNKVRATFETMKQQGMIETIIGKHTRVCSTQK